MKYELPKGINKSASIGWCPGCGHGIVCRIICEAIQELDIDDRIILVEDVACGEFAQSILQYNSIGAAHGRPIITAAGAKRARPDSIVIARPGDGSAYSIGIESTIHCALRNENITVVVVNNSVFGMTGGQMSPTSLPGMKTSSTIKGRDTAKNGAAFDAMKVLSQFDIAYLARGAVDSPAHISQAQKMITKALSKQMSGKGYSFVEILSPCPTNWGKKPADAMAFIREEQSKYFPIGEYIDK